MTHCEKISLVNMLHIESFEVNINVDNPIEFYANGAQQSALAHIRAIYEGICYMGCLILRITDIARIGECQFVSPTKPCVGLLAVQFRAIITQYSPGDTITVTMNNDIVTTRIFGRSTYASALFISDPANLDIHSAISPKSVVYATIVDVGAFPGYSSISARVELRKPTNALRESSGARCYPILRNTLDNVFTSRELTDEKYVTSVDDKSGGLSLQSMARAIRARIDQMVAEYAKSDTQKGIPIVARALLCSKVTAATRALPLDGIEIVDLINMRKITQDATYLVVFDSVNPLDAQIGVISTDISALPPLAANWRKDDIPRKCSEVIAMLLEQYITVALAYESMMSELTDGDKLKASASIIRALTALPASR